MPPHLTLIDNTATPLRAPRQLAMSKPVRDLLTGVAADLAAISEDISHGKGAEARQRCFQAVQKLNRAVHGANVVRS